MGSYQKTFTAKMTIRTCDKCGKETDDLTEVLDEYGKYELCDKCEREINAIIWDYKSKELNRIKEGRLRVFAEWIEVKHRPSILTRLYHKIF